MSGPAVPNVTDWQYLNLNYVTKAEDQPGRLHQMRPLLCACEDTSHQAISHGRAERVFEVMTRNASPATCASMSARSKIASQWSRWPPGTVDPRTGKVVEEEYANWTTHPNNPAAQAAE